VEEFRLPWGDGRLIRLELGFESGLVPRQLVLHSFPALVRMLFSVLAVGAFAAVAQNVGRKALAI
jgi:hypothetical protein